MFLLNPITCHAIGIVPITMLSYNTAVSQQKNLETNKLDVLESSAIDFHSTFILLVHILYIYIIFYIK